MPAACNMYPEPPPTGGNTCQNQRPGNTGGAHEFVDLQRALTNQVATIDRDNSDLPFWACRQLNSAVDTGCM
jgi:hypothetical protein